KSYVFISPPLTWANKFCRENYTNLATFESMDDLKMLQRPDNSTSPSWIGLDSNSWRWSVTGKTSTTTYHNWASGQPDNGNGKEFCVTMRTDATWFDDNCASTRPFVCYTGQRTYTMIPNLMTWNNAQAYCRAHHTDLATIDNALQNEEIFSQASANIVWIGLYRVAWSWCDRSTSTFRNWYHYVDLLMTWSDAQKYCRENYTNLATLESMDDLKMLQRPYSSTSPSWIGLYDDPESWKGTLGSDSNSWRWSVTGKTSTTTYHNWASGQPDNLNGKEFCVTMRTDATWFDDNCASTRPFVCYTGKRIFA
uniref:C-type lectin domain-containing protein n=1 Tax=Mastacembelus armatus TaxID=205130 RepID=A0A3Q3S3P7_9TELE